MCAQAGRMTLAGAALIALSTGAEAATCSYQDAHGNVIDIEGSATTTVDGPGSFTFLGGTDIIFADVTWVGGTRGVFRGINGATSGFPYGAQVYDSTLQPNVIKGTLACLSQGGGLQFGQPGDAPIYGNIVHGVTAISTGDDSIAFFNDIGTGVTQSVVEQTTITGSNDRFVLLTEDPSRILATNPDCPGIGSATGQAAPHRKPVTLLPCTSPVYVDIFTRQHI